MTNSHESNKTPIDFRIIFESIPDLYIVLNNNSEIVAISETCLKATKATRETILGQAIFAAFPSFEKRYWSSSSTPIYDGDGNLEYTLYRVLDIPEFFDPKKSVMIKDYVDTDINLPLVLVIEDNVEVNQYICGVLTGVFRTASAYDGQDGLEKIFELRPDIILSDIMMPKMDGLQLIRKIRENDDFQDIPIIIISSKVDHDIAKKILAAGAQDYLAKPFSHAELKTKVANVLSSKKSTTKATGK